MYKYPPHFATYIDNDDYLCSRGLMALATELAREGYITFLKDKRPLSLSYIFIKERDYDGNDPIAIALMETLFLKEDEISTEELNTDRWRKRLREICDLGEEIIGDELGMDPDLRENRETRSKKLLYGSIALLLICFAILVLIDAPEWARYSTIIPAAIYCYNYRKAEKIQKECILPEDKLYLIDEIEDMKASMGEINEETLSEDIPYLIAFDNYDEKLRSFEGTIKAPSWIKGDVFMNKKTLHAFLAVIRMAGSERPSPVDDPAI